MKKLLLTLTLLAVASAKATVDPNEQLFDAVECGSLTGATTALNAGADVNALKGEETPLSIAVWQENIELIGLLLEHGADCTLSDSGLNGALNNASSNNLHGALEIMLVFGSVEQDSLDRALFSSIECMRDIKGCDLCLKKTVTLLLEHGANPFIYYDDEQYYNTQGTACELAKQLGLTKIVQLFTRCADHGGIQSRRESKCDDCCCGE